MYNASVIIFLVLPNAIQSAVMNPPAHLSAKTFRSAVNAENLFSCRSFTPSAVVCTFSLQWCLVAAWHVGASVSFQNRYDWIAFFPSFFAWCCF